MADSHVETLRQARETFVRKRRLLAEQMVPEGAAAQHFALQSAIEAIDRAIQDEERLPDGYGEVTAAPERPGAGATGSSVGTREASSWTCRRWLVTP